ncbi:hypothetical protein DPMN_008327 [Dreissena polymorpha]|uniref:Matrin-type domain-containing protein n=1 Tax=Dreissena polymorpha TaxID=45954 RepID=A0A9D4MZ26_DREPO|nr:hypothetical protein DPMN_008327 [Dreissena polymorpha]
MPSGKTKFNPSWMEKLDNIGKTLGSWCKRDTGNEFAGYCTVCMKSISCNSDANNLISHADGQKHKENMKYMHDNSQKRLFGSAPKPSSSQGGWDKSICMQVHPSHN